MEPFKWQCPHCNHHTIITRDNFVDKEFGLTIDNADGSKLLYTYYVVCPNSDCNKYVLGSILYDSKYEYRDEGWDHYDQKEIKRWRMVSNSFAKVFPDYIPEQIIQDYNEACAIVDESAKASATLARRCLQGMIRDFWKVKSSSLFKEIEKIKDEVDPLTWKSIDATRKIGNIGAHMEKDINLIIDVNPEEAQALIKLIEILIKDWYINRHEREATLSSIVNSGEEKSKAKRKTNPNKT